MEGNQPETSFEGESEKIKLAHLKEICARLYGTENNSGYNLIFNKAKDIRSKYSDYEDYRLYHLIIGSTPRGECLKFDFPGEDSIELFLNEAEAKLRSEEN